MPRKSELKSLLQKIADNLQNDLKPFEKSLKLALSKNLKFLESNGSGYSCVVFRIKNVKGYFELWLDEFSNIGRPVLALSFACKDIGMLIEGVKTQQGSFVDDHNPECELNLDKSVKLTAPLGKRYSDKFLFENYDWQYVSMYFSEALEDLLSKAFRKKLKDRAEQLAALSLTNKKSNQTSDFPHTENRESVRLHKFRERSKKLADERKEMDKFICKVCNMNFAQTYGGYGIGYAEAHHIIPLSKIKSTTKTNLKDLITVCANCHRMLHRMEGHSDDHQKLRKIFLSRKK